MICELSSEAAAGLSAGAVIPRKRPGLRGGRDELPLPGRARRKLCMQPSDKLKGPDASRHRPASIAGIQSVQKSHTIAVCPGSEEVRRRAAWKLQETSSKLLNKALTLAANRVWKEQPISNMENIPATLIELHLWSRERGRK